MKSLISETKFAVLFLVLMSAFSALTLLENEPEKVSLKVADTKNVSTSSNANELTLRAPASVLSELESSITTQFFCKNSKEMAAPSRQKINKNMVMLNFKLCLDEKLVDSVSLLNQTNGFRAQIFKHQLGQYKTDYIQLSEGSNTVQVDVILKDGQKTVDSLVILTGS